MPFSFDQLAEHSLNAIETALDRQIPDADYNRSGPVLTVENDASEQLIIDRHDPSEELWIASRLGAHHFRWDPSQQNWLHTRSQGQIHEYLDPALSELFDQAIELDVSFAP